MTPLFNGSAYLSGGDVHQNATTNSPIHETTYRLTLRNSVRKFSLPGQNIGHGIGIGTAVKLDDNLTIQNVADSSDNGRIELGHDKEFR